MHTLSPFLVLALPLWLLLLVMMEHHARIQDHHLPLIHLLLQVHTLHSARMSGMTSHMPRPMTSHMPR